MYQVFKIPKRSGGFRIIEAPDPELKLTQQRLINPISKQYRVSCFAHAFQPYKNIVTMAGSHVGREYVGCLDITDFFPSITLILFTSHARLVPYNPDRPDIAELVNPCFHDFGDGKGERLPQGAPTSPLLSNIFMHNFDWIMAHSAGRLDCNYSRYADDLVFSGNTRSHIKVLFKIAGYYLGKMKLKINQEKTKIMHRSGRQLVCGIIVNKKINLPRKFKKNLRAEIFQQKGEQVSDKTQGRVAFSKMVLENKKDFRSCSEILNTIKLQKQLMK